MWRGFRRIASIKDMRFQLKYSCLMLFIGLGLKDRQNGFHAE